MNIRKGLEKWNGKSVDDISRLYGLNRTDEAFVNVVISLFKQPDCESGATWLLKRYLEDHKRIDDSHLDEVFKSLAGLNHWQSKLHLLQCLSYFKISKSNKRRLELFLRECLTSSNKFVRAWAYNGFYELTIQHPQYMDETKSFFEMAMRDEAPSVKARIRNIMKQGF
ncbi:MAG: hypothetical protein N0C81_20330 [Candidatus Thiodiazotropha lotti]|uniref:Uncharacterized protein n=1 Tax=Candidatus Thiodiazotropha lotti TaxID=2792787 RepID=A0A9E4K261_9GAMM|nr:hypothetical protein [Candidatus Thiodiazotropha lotti]MCG7921996.1 hypothetical protein [Candidatus Thiodiazotropha lotti]MCG7928867.1 hypothetical protein [Candidatus Thiodiazotropha lotti]MCG7937603.1 hypothetical protein [Candidatus Thiodiazotropha lotti]MCG7989776.1 hypothetical protein [Candidatus Thiodiazotropha lotti]